MNRAQRHIFDRVIGIISQNQPLANILKEQCMLYGFKNVHIFADWQALDQYLTQEMINLIISDQFPPFQDDHIRAILEAHKSIQSTIPVVWYAQTPDDLPLPTIPAGLTLIASLRGREEQQRLLEVIHNELQTRALVEDSYKTQYHILVVTSDQELGGAMQRILQQTGYPVHHIDNGKEALAYIRQTLVSIVFLDYELPQLSGFSLLYWLQHTRPDIVVILMGAAQPPNMITEFIKTGVYSYLAKPFDVGVLPILCQELHDTFEAVFTATALPEKREEREQSTQESEEVSLLKKSEEHFRTLVNASGDIIFRITPQGILSFASPAVEEQLAYTQEDLEQKRINIAKFVHTDDFIRVMVGIREVIRGASIQSLECRLMHKDQEHFRWYSVSCYPMYNSEHTFVGIGGIARDISSLKQFEQEIRQRNKQLEELNKLKDDFVAIVSHDLRSPLTAILGSAELLLSDEFMEPALTEEQKELVSNIQFMGKQQLQLVNDLLDLAKTESGTLELHPTVADLRAITQQCYSTLHVLAHQKDITVKFIAAPNLPRTRMDVPKIYQVINNLLGNAIKFTEMGGTITLRVEAENNQFLKVSVNDTGAGIEPKHLSQLFSKFQQVRTHGTGGEKGSGLGLAICKNLIELHHGKIWAESRVGIGSTFTFTLPIVENIVLIIDDSVFVSKTLEDMIVKHLENVKVLSAQSGENGLKQIEAEFPAVIILDYMMPDMDGIAVFQALQERYGARVPPTIFLTASPDLEVRRRIFELGAADYLQKPVDVNDLLPRLSRFL